MYIKRYIKMLPKTRPTAAVPCGTNRDVYVIG